MDSVAALVAQIESANPDMVYAGGASAYEAFSSGKTLFDLSPNADLLREFQLANASEFGSDIYVEANGSFRSFTWGGEEVYCTYHIHRLQKYKTGPELSQLERDRPELSW